MNSISLAFLLRVGRAQHGLEQFGVQHDLVQVVADGVDVDVLVDQLDGLGAQRVPEQPARAGGRLDGDVDLREPAIVVLVGHQDRVGRERFPQVAEHAVVGGEGVAHVVVGQAVLRGEQPFVAGQAAVHAREVGQALLHGVGQLDLERLDVGDDPAEAFFVEFSDLATSSNTPR